LAATAKRSRDTFCTSDKEKASEFSAEQQNSGLETEITRRNLGKNCGTKRDTFGTSVKGAASEIIRRRKLGKN
jgi:hypothetical protein